MNERIKRIGETRRRTWARLRGVKQDLLMVLVLRRAEKKDARAFAIQRRETHCTTQRYWNRGSPWQ